MSKGIEFVRLNQAWDELGISPATGWRRIKLGLLPKPVRVGPNSTRFIRAELEQAKAALIDCARGAA